MNRIVCLVADGFGVGAAPDADKYGDVGANTLAHTAAAVGGLRLPHLQRLGLGNLGEFAGIPKASNPLALVGRMAEKSEGKDTTTGHWEIAGLVTHVPFSLFPQGFPAELLTSFIREAGIPGVLANRPASEPRSSSSLEKKVFGRENPSSIPPATLSFRWRRTRNLSAWSASIAFAKPPVGLPFRIISAGSLLARSQARIRVLFVGPSIGGIIRLPQVPIVSIFFRSMVFPSSRSAR